jgi:hypothetical protein
LDESRVLQEFRGSAPVRRQIELSVLEKTLATDMQQESYAPQLYGSIAQRQTKEDPLTPMMPLNERQELFAVGIRQRLPYGTSIDGSIFGSQSDGSNDMYENATQSGLKVAARVNLLKNPLGELDRQTLELTHKQRDRAELESRVTLHAAEARIRKAWWGLVATWQSLQLSRELIASADKQLRDTKQRLRLGVADRGEVARQEAQVAGRQASSLLYEYELEVAFEALAKAVPTIERQRWTLGPASIGNVESAVKECMATIMQRPTVDPSMTLTDEIVASLGDEARAESLIATKHDAAELSLVADVQSTGVDDGWTGSADKLAEERKTGWGLGLEFVMPLGETPRRTEATLAALKRDALSARSEELAAEMAATHASALRSLNLLTQGLATQQANTRGLAASLRETKIKFDQGRVPVGTIILEQDALFQAELQEIALRRQIAFAVLDYMAVFTQTPCAWNKI